jgi:hypothetical protein
MEEKILKIPHILDQIIHHLKDDDYINLLIALKLGKVHTLRQLKISQNLNIETMTTRWRFRWRLSRLLNLFLRFFTPNEIRSNFDIIWENTTYLSNFNENFFIDNYDLIDHKKLLKMKYEFHVNNDFCVSRDFSRAFHDRFPTFSSLKVCSNFLQCENEIVHDANSPSVMPSVKHMCFNCYTNKCPRCDYVMLPKLILSHGRYCESCDGCPQYSDYSCF